jgi:hypothetical protein
MKLRGRAEAIMRWGWLLAMVSVAGAASATDVDLKVSKVVCPSEAVVELCWTESIGSDPVFHPYETSFKRCREKTVGFVGLWLSKSAVYCRYHDGNDFDKDYVHNVDGEITAVRSEGRNFVEFEWTPHELRTEPAASDDRSTIRTRSAGPTGRDHRQGSDAGPQVSDSAPDGTTRPGYLWVDNGKTPPHWERRRAK